jgi:aspartate/methionine/tyrosine aminotransferase
MNSVYRSRRAWAGEIMRTLHCRYDEKQVGLFLWGKIPEGAGSAETLADRVLYEANVFITPGFIFGSQGDRYVRISLCCKNETLEEAFNRIQKHIK